MKIVKGRIAYSDSNDSLIEDAHGYVTCGCGCPIMKLVKVSESTKRYVNTYHCENCNNTITATHIRRGKQYDDS